VNIGIVASQPSARLTRRSLRFDGALLLRSLRRSLPNGSEGSIVFFVVNKLKDFDIVRRPVRNAPSLLTGARSSGGLVYGLLLLLLLQL
jgi:hypothetical protein